MLAKRSFVEIKPLMRDLDLYMTSFLDTKSHCDYLLTEKCRYAELKLLQYEVATKQMQNMIESFDDLSSRIHAELPVAPLDRPPFDIAFPEYAHLREMKFRF